MIFHIITSNETLTRTTKRLLIIFQPYTTEYDVLIYPRPRRRSSVPGPAVALDGAHAVADLVVDVGVPAVRPGHRVDVLPAGPRSQIKRIRSGHKQ